jgi:hypothetical protein
MVRMAAMRTTEDHQALGERKQTAASIQQETSRTKVEAMYQRKTVQSMERWVRRAVKARMGAKRERRWWD